ncbi:MAG: ribonuclease HII [Candidatus Anoxymicrobium japonicum]|uniref:Ribonuclease n=1 Tax=Candidatus Anoxymicrobium japonicum TaxID=2013648 RepID=A0A2N3G890_9ACTN|nr:MAG: ribonuclease HII [Candidatus Anoxymicrobium japonicum]
MVAPEPLWQASRTGWFRAGLTIGGKNDIVANEDLFREDAVNLIAGADEAGRGALAGPLAAAAVMFEPGVEVEGVNDSKALAPGRREELYLEILEAATSVSVIFTDSCLIDSWGLQTANLKALADALAGIEPACDCGICDHYSPSGLPFPTYGIPHADSRFHSVAAASIVAKVERDRVMRSMHRRFPRYNFEHNKGYGSREHMEALVAHGPCEIHRLSFSGVADAAVEMPLWENQVEL